MYDSVLRGGVVVNVDGKRQVDVAVLEGKVAALLPRAAEVEAAEILDVRGMYILPGCIDPHTHLWEPGLVARSDFRDGTRAAACGGVTTIIDHPLTIPEVISIGVFNDKRELGETTSYLDFALHGGITRTNHAELKPMWDAGATAFKFFMCESGSAVEHLRDTDIRNALEVVGSFSGIVMAHAEDQLLMDLNERSLRATGRVDNMSLVAWRSPEVEIEAISRLAQHCVDTGTSCVVVHTSVPEGCDLAKGARTNDADVVVETCPHYLYFTEADLDALGPLVKCQPPVRDEKRVQRLWHSLADGDVMMIGSDHGPVRRDLKDIGENDIWAAQGGMPSVETMLSVLLDGVAAGRISIEQVVSVTSTYSARWYGLYPRKGLIAPGADADFTIVDMAEKWTVHAASLTSNCGWTPFEGRTLTGRVRRTILRGHTVAVDGRLSKDESPGYGTFLASNHEFSGSHVVASSMSL